AFTLDVLLERSGPDDPAHVWLVGRASEVRAFAADAARAWMVGECDDVRATAAIAGYLASLHAALRPGVGEWYAPACCGPLGPVEPPASFVQRVQRVRHVVRPMVPRVVRRRFDSQADTASMSGSLSGARAIRLHRA